MKKAVLVFSGGLDSVCTAVYLKSRYRIYGITYVYGQKADQEIKMAKYFAKLLKLEEHKIANIDFMKDLYHNTNALTDSKIIIPEKFDYTIVVPIRNAVFLSIASAWAFSKNATLVAYGAHRGDIRYPDCRPSFSKKITQAFNQAEIDGIRMHLRKKIQVWSPFMDGFTKHKLLEFGYKKLGKEIFKTWSCYENGKIHCGRCESCQNRKSAFKQAKITDKTVYKF